jgi:putative restriction endonuclease
MPIRFDALKIGQAYTREFLAETWGYNGPQGLRRGVFLPKDRQAILLFVTKTKTSSMTPYNDFIDGNFLFWEGEEQHGSDKRIIGAQANGTPIHLFYREIHSSPFVYFGKIELVDCIERTDKPSEFLFSISTFDPTTAVISNVSGRQERLTLERTESEVLGKARVGQGRFRRDVIRFWGACAITGFAKISVLKASHIKPWSRSDNAERLNPFNGLLLLPNFDTLFDLGLISFEDNGRLLVSSQVADRERELLSLHESLRLRKVHSEHAQFLRHHRHQSFLGS